MGGWKRREAMPTVERIEAKSAILNEGRIIFYPSNWPGSAKCVLELAIY
jgi:hypothetical protein